MVNIYPIAAQTNPMDIVFKHSEIDAAQRQKNPALADGDNLTLLPVTISGFLLLTFQRV